MPYNTVYTKTESATASCSVGRGSDAYAVVSSQSIISQRDADRKALGWAQALATSRLHCVLSGIEVSPAWGISTTGDSGGPFADSTIVYTLTNISFDPIDWTVSSDTPSWVSVSSSSGTLAARDSVEITVAINDSATSALALGVSSSIVSFVNTTNGIGSTTRPVELDLVASITFEQYSGPFVFPSALPTDGERYYSTASVTGDNAVNFAGVPGNPGPSPDGTNTIAFSGSVSYDPLTGTPTGLLSADITFDGLVNGLTVYSNPATVTVSAASYDGLLTNISSAGAVILSEMQSLSQSRSTYVARYYTLLTPTIGAFVLRGTYAIYAPADYELTYSDIVSVSDLGYPVTQTGVPARTQYITSYDPNTDTFEGDKSTITYAVVPEAGKTEATTTFTFLVTPDVGTPYTQFVVQRVSIVGSPLTVYQDFPWIVGATVYLQSASVSYRPAYFEDFESYDDTELYTYLSASPSWDTPAVLFCPPPNSQCWDNFETYSTSLALTNFDGGYGWDGVGVTTAVDYTRVYDTFEQYDEGEVYALAMGLGWTNPAAIFPINPPRALDDFESYVVGDLTTFNYSSIQVLWSGNGESY